MRSRLQTNTFAAAVAATKATPITEQKGPSMAASFEAKWQRCWSLHNVFATSDDFSKPKYYALDMFPYPSAAGLHVGHPLGYTATDIVSRFYRMRGYNVLHPMGWDAFGLPAEQHAIETGEHPARVTDNAKQNFKRQLMSLGFSYDWSREVSTSDPSYYHWTQWIFTRLFEAGLAYQAQVFVNWCPYLKTVLANEEVIDGKSERGGHPVFRVPMTQWMLRITAYAERLLRDLDDLDWPTSTKDIQRHWIGRSEGAKVHFTLPSGEPLTVFTTRPDTLFGVSFLVIAPEHSLCDVLVTSDNAAAITSYKEAVSRKTDLERTELNKDKTGVFTGSFALHPLTGQPVPIWVADYVMISYGTGAVMGVPAHDERDHEFARKYGLVIQPVIQSPDSSFDYQKEAYTGDGLCMHSGAFDGLSALQAKDAITQHLVTQGQGEKTVQYKLRDWVFSRQRYWGEPIPILKDGQGHILRALRDDELPLTLPAVTSYEPTGDGKSPLSVVRTWVERTDENGQTTYLETDTMPGSAGSSWYFLRYVDPFNQSCLASYDKLKYWLPVDLYVGGQEHAVGHLLYARFWTKVLFDAGVCPVSEPFQKLVHQGLICRGGSKMSKSKGNGISPDEIVNRYSADALRVYEMFMGPLSQTKEWEDQNLAGIHRFLNRVERLFVGADGNSRLTDQEPTTADYKIIHKTIKKVSEDISSLSFNTAIAQLMIALNTLTDTGCSHRELLGLFLKVLSPFAPHLAEELWHKCIAGAHRDPELESNYPFISTQPWPIYEDRYVQEEEISIGIQVNGKLRGTITLPVNSSQADAVSVALAVGSVQTALGSTTPRKVIYVANKILNFVV